MSSSSLPWKRLAWGVALILLAQFVVCALTARELGITADERTHVASGRILLNTGNWENKHLRYQGPLALYASQVFLDREDFAGGVDGAIVPARMALLPLGALCSLLVFAWSRRLFGDSGGLLSLGVCALNPIFIGYASLATVDVAMSTFLVLALYLCWRLLVRPSALAAGLVGGALALALATKYVALLLAPILALAVLLSAWLAPRDPQRGLAARLRAAAGHVLAFGIALLVVLHVCYALRAGFAPTDPELYGSPLVRRLMSTPGLSRLLGFLPRPFLLGIDMQLGLGHGQHMPFLNGRLAPGHWDYYLWTLATKMPEILLALASLAVFLSLPAAWKRGGRGLRLACGLLALALVLPLLYLSLGTTYQVGIRYILWVVPLMSVLSGALASDSWLARLPRLPRAALAAAAGILLLFDGARAWPNLIAYYNTASGGMENGWRHFRDSNSEWMQLQERGLALLRASEREPFEVLSGSAGPRFGRVATYLDERLQPDPEDPTRLYHWLDAFEPVRVVGAAWLLYALDEPGFRRAAEGAGDERVRAGFTVALLGAGSLAEAQAELSRMSPARAREPQRILDLLRAQPPVAADPARTLELCQLWLAVGRADLAYALLCSPQAPAPATTVALRGRALIELGRYGESADLLLREGDLEHDPGLLLLLAGALNRAGRNLEAVALLDRHAELLRSLLSPQVDALLAEIRQRGELWKDLQRGLR